MTKQNRENRPVLPSAGRGGMQMPPKAPDAPQSEREALCEAVLYATQAAALAAETARDIAKALAKLPVERSPRYEEELPETGFVPHTEEPLI